MENNDNWKKKDTKSLLKYLADKLQERARLDTQMSELNKFVNEIDNFTAQRMADDDVPEMTLELNGEKIKFAVTDEEQFSLNKEVTEHTKWDNPEYFAWLKSIGEETLIKKKESVPAPTRKKHLRQMREQGIDMPDFVKVSFYTHLKYNKKAIERVSQ